MKSKPCWVPLAAAELVFLATHRNVDRVAQSLLFLALKQPAKLMGLEDFSLLKARLCQHKYTHMSEPTLTLLKVHKTQLPLPLLSSCTQEAPNTAGVKHSWPSHWDAAPKSSPGASCAPCLRQLSDYLP